MCRPVDGPSLISINFRVVKPGFKRLLLVDDDEDDREFFLQVMEEVLPEVSCETATNGRIALDKLNTTHQRPDLIFLDLNMPLMNGRQFLHEIRNYKHLMEIPVVILSTSSDAQTIGETIALGAKHFITKPDLLQGWELALRGFFENIEKYLNR
jgi:CheY-like chemotaxis protein